MCEQKQDAALQDYIYDSHGWPNKWGTFGKKLLRKLFGNMKEV
jgi:hypothetical protein